MTRTRILVYLGIIAALFVIAAAWYGLAFVRAGNRHATPFDGEHALQDVQTQVAFGPRVPGSDAHARVLAWMESELAAAGWTTRRQQAETMGHPIINLIASRSPAPAQVIVGAHYDTRLLADRDADPALRSLPGPGADDGASGVAVLLELARTLPPDTIPVALVFFDAEDNGHVPGWDWILGSTAFAAELDHKPQAMILLDMVGDRDLGMPMEGASDPALRASIWSTAARLGHQDVFRSEVGGAILDDHNPFLDAGIPAVDIIDIDYPYWHTSQDTPDKLSSRSLQTVGDVVWTWLVDQKPVSPGPGD